MVEDTERMYKLFPPSHMRNLLEVDVDHINNLLFPLTTHHRIVSSLDYKGPALQFVAGTPDASHLEKI